MKSSTTDSLRLLVIDDSQLDADRLVDELKSMGTPTRVQLLDDKEELTKALRQPWDIILLGRAYDLTPQDTVALVRSSGKDLPIIVMPDQLSNTAVNGELDTTPSEIAQLMEQGITDVIPRMHLSHLVNALRRELRNLCFRRSQRELEYMLSEAERRAQLLLKNSRSAVAYFDDGVHIYANETYLQLFRHESMEELIGMPVIDLVAKEDITKFKEFIKNYSKGDHSVSEFNFTGRRADGSSFEAQLQLAPASYEGEPCIQIIIQSQAEASTELEAQLAAVERLDPLTGLGNRRAFEEALITARTQAIRQKTQQALLFVSVDNIGQINASAGLAGSDATMTEVAKVLSETFPQADKSRFGESTFTVIVKDTSSEKIVAQAETLCATIKDLLISVSNRTVQTTVSVGIAMIGETSPDETELTERAYEAADKVKLKTKGVGNGVNLYNPAENASESDSAMRELLEDALEKGKFHLMFQGLYDTQDELNQFFEVFVRLPVADGKLLTPDEFMPAVQRFKMNGRLDRWVLLNACKRLKSHLVQYPNARLLINLTADSLQDPSLPALTGKLISALGISSGKPLVLQFAENDVITYLKIAKENTEQFSQNGCMISVSNFGSSMNSMDLLNHIPADLLKIDKSYVHDLTVEENFQAAQKIVTQLSEMGKDSIAAYIESPAAMSKAWTMGVRFLQGYYLQPPNDEMTPPSQG